MSLRLGFDAQYIDATFSNALDFSTLCLGGPASAPACGAFGLTTPGQPATDGTVELSADDWSFGYNVGVLLEPSETTRIGVHYRSHIEHELGGEADFTVPVPAFAAATGAFQDTGASTVLDLPDSVSVSAYHQLDDRFAVLGDITWTHWSRFDQIVVRFDNPRQPDLVTPQDWEDAFRYALGIRYHAEGPVTLRVGAAYDETPVPDPRLRSPRIPDQDRVWLTFGASYRYSEAIALDFAYAHLFIDDARVENTEVITGHVLNGDFDGEIDIVAAQLVWHMRALRVSTRTFGAPRVPAAPSKLTRIAGAGHVRAGLRSKSRNCRPNCVGHRDSVPRPSSATPLLCSWYRPPWRAWSPARIYRLR
jgi:long-chain fatty acid transport protein